MKAAVAALLLLFASGAGAATPGARVAFTQVDGSRTVVAVYDADATAGAAVAVGSDPSWSPDGGKLAFAADGDVAVVDAGGGAPTRLTTDAGPDVSNVSPQWSPRGDWISFLKVTRNVPQVWLVSPSGAGARAVTATSGQKSAPRFSPDGSRLVWVDDGAVFVAPVAGGPPVRIVQFGRSPSWSPDGSRIAYSNGPLFVVNADGSGAHQVANLSYTDQASWSPDGTHLAFLGTRVFPQFSSRYGPAGRTDLFTVAADGNDLRRITGPPADDTLYGYQAGDLPTWWPDGSRLFFRSARGQESTTVFEVNADGSCEGKFAPDAPRLATPAWRPGAPALGPRRCVDLRVLASAENNVAALRKPAVLRFTIDNDGNLTATGVTVTFSALGGGSVTLLGPCTGPAPCTLSPILPHGSVTATVSVTGAGPGYIGARADVVSREAESDPATNTSQVAVQVLNCTSVGTWGADYLVGTPGRDRICGLPGADRVFGLAGNDYLDAGNGDDRITGGPGRDTIEARGGTDVVYARDGERDTIDCGSEQDVAVVDRLDTVHRCEVVARSR